MFCRNTLISETLLVKVRYNPLKLFHFFGLVVFLTSPVSFFHKLKMGIVVLCTVSYSTSKIYSTWYEVFFAKCILVLKSEQILNLRGILNVGYIHQTYSMKTLAVINK